MSLSAKTFVSRNWMVKLVLAALAVLVSVNFIFAANETNGNINGTPANESFVFDLAINSSDNADVIDNGSQIPEVVENQTLVNETNTSLDNNGTIAAPGLNNQSANNDTIIIPEANVFTKIKDLTVNKFSVIRGDVIRITAMLADETDNALPSEVIDLYAGDALIGLGETDASGNVLFNWNTSDAIPAEYLLNLSFPGRTTASAQQSINLVPSYDFIFVTVRAEQLADNTTGNITNVTRAQVEKVDVAEEIATPQIREMSKGNYYFTSKDSAWTILKKDYLTKYIDYDFVYVNDSYYRVDWVWNDEYVREIVRTCLDLETASQQECIRNVSADSIISAFESGMSRISPLGDDYFNASESCYQLDNREAVMTCIKETALTPPPVNQNLMINKWPKLIQFANLSEICGSSLEQGSLECRKGLAKSIFDHIDYDVYDFSESFFPEKSVSVLKSDVKYLKSNDMPKKVIKGSAEFVGVVNPLGRNNGSFYIKLKDGFDNSNGLRVEWGLDSILAEFNNSKTTESLVFTVNGIKNVTRYLELPKDTVVLNATLSITGSRIALRNYSIDSENFYDVTAIKSPFMTFVDDDQAIYGVTHYNGDIFSSLNITKYWKDNLTIQWAITLPSHDNVFTAIDDHFLYACQMNGASKGDIYKINKTNGTIVITKTNSCLGDTANSPTKVISANTTESYIFSVNDSRLIKLLKSDLSTDSSVSVPTLVFLTNTICQNTNELFFLSRNFSASYNKSNLAQNWNRTLIQTGPSLPIQGSASCVARDDFVLFKAKDGNTGGSRTWKIFVNGTLGVNVSSSTDSRSLYSNCGRTDSSGWQTCDSYWEDFFFKVNTSTLNVIWSYSCSSGVCDGFDRPIRINQLVIPSDDEEGFLYAYVADSSTSTYNLTKLERKYPNNASINVDTDDFIEYQNNSGLEGVVSGVSLNVSSLNSALNGGACDCSGCGLIGEMCFVPIVFSSNSTGVLEYSNINIIYNTAPVFSVGASDDSSFTSTTDTNANVTFISNISDADNDDVKFLVCDSSGRSGIGCLDTEYCNTGFGAPGSKSCQFNTSSLAGVEYNWTSFACDNSSACVAGVNGNFYITRPADPVLYVNGSTVWNYTGLFDGPVTVENFEDELLNELAACDTDECNVSLVFYSDSNGKLEISVIDIQYATYDTEAPIVHSITVDPSPVLINSSMNVTVNVTDNVNLTRVSAAHEEASVNLSYNAATGLWNGSMISPSTAGLHRLNVTAVDSSNLTTINSTVSNGASNLTADSPPVVFMSAMSGNGSGGGGGGGGGGGNPELMIYSDYITYSPSELLENKIMNINVTVYNFNGADASNFRVELQVDGVQQTYNTISLAGSSSSVTRFSWNATVGNHTLKIVADYTNLITEDNETNNDGSINVSVQDVTPPTISSVVTERGSLNLMVNITDNQNISSAVAVVNGTEIVLTYNSSSGLYEGHDTTIAAGTYPMTIKVVDSEGLTTTSQTSVTVYPDPVDLSVSDEDLWLSSPSPADQESVVVYARVRNRGINSSGNFTVEFALDGVSQANNTLFVAGDGNTTTQFNWVAGYGNHTVEINVDSAGNVSEVDESDNQVSRSVNVSDITLPAINELLIPSIIYETGVLNVRVNATDNAGVSTVNVSFGSSAIILFYNSSLKLYENSSLAPAAGVYVLEVTAVDVNALASTLQENVRVYSSQADLAVGVGDIILLPSNVTENSQLNVTATIRNLGGADADNVKMELLVDGASKQNATYSFGRASQNATLLAWTAVYGSHNVTVRVDSDGGVSESNESNNERSRTVFVLDVTPPPPVSLSANPANWTNQTTHNISWISVSDANGIDRYEYRIDYGNWTSVGLGTSFVTPSQADGVHTVYVRVVDIPGNVGNVSNVSVYIDSPVPNAPVLKEWHSGSNWTQHASPYLSWVDPGDEGSGIVNFTISVDGGQEVGLGRNLTYHGSNLTTGSHTFKVKAYDALNQSSPWSNTVTVKVDTVAPGAPQISSVTHPDNGTWYAVNMPYFNITPPADDSGIKGYYYVFDQVFNSTPDTTTRWAVNSTLNITSSDGLSQFGLNGTNNTDVGVANGEWYLHVRAMDAAGNLGSDVAHYYVKINVTPASLSVGNLSAIYSNLSDKTFEFVITNVDNEAVSANWTADFGDGNVASSNSGANLGIGESVSVFAGHSYLSQGSYVVVVTAQAGSSVVSSNISVSVVYLDVSNLSFINISGTKRTFEFIATNMMPNSLSSVGWSFDTGNTFKFNSSSNVTLVPAEGFSVFVDYDYGTTGSFVVNASAMNNTIADYEVLDVNIN